MWTSTVEAYELFMSKSEEKLHHPELHVLAALLVTRKQYVH